jgi:uncharacterized membrane protein (DUF373 family)
MKKAKVVEITIITAIREIMQRCSRYEGLYIGYIPSFIEAEK